MSKPTERQKAVIEAIRMELDYWKDSNDIHSPSHGTSIENDMFVNLLDAHMPPDYDSIASIEKAVGALHTLISNMDPCPMRAEERRRL